MTLTRRQFILSATGSIVAATGIGNSLSSSTQPINPKAPESPFLPQRFAGITSSNQFFSQRIRTIPVIETSTWQVQIDGLVESPYVLTYQSLRELSAQDVPCTVACIGNPPGGNWIGHGQWRGVPLSDILQRANVFSEAHYAHFLCSDGYVTSLPIEQLSNALLAFELNGQPLTLEHGFPARIIVPGLYGYKMPKWLQKIELSASPVAGFWEGRGWSGTGVVQTTSAIFSPHHGETVSGSLVLSGIAFAGERTITRVDLSISGSAWMPVPLSASTPYCWTSWQIDWMPPAPGEYQIKVRATDSSGFTQSEHASLKPFPDGTSGLHAVTVRVAGL